MPINFVYSDSLETDTTESYFSNHFLNARIDSNQLSNSEYDPILENVTIYNVQNVSGIKIISLLLKPEKLQHHFKIINQSKMLLDVKPNDKLLFLAHKEKNQNISEVQLAFDADYRIKQFVIVDLNRNYRKINFNHLNIRPQLNKADFEFTLPDGIEIIDKTNEKQ